MASADSIPAGEDAALPTGSRTFLMTYSRAGSSDGTWLMRGRACKSWAKNAEAARRTTIMCRMPSSRRWGHARACRCHPQQLDPEAVALQVDTIDEMRTSVVKVNDLRHERIGKIERDAAVFSQDVTHLTGAMASDLAEVEPEEAVLQLDRRLAEAKRTRDLMKEKDDAIATLEQVLERA